MKGDSYFYSENYEFIKSIYEQYCFDPMSVDASWIEIFQSLCNAEPFKKSKEFSEVFLFFKAINLIGIYRRYGCYFADLDPLKLSSIKSPVSLDHEFYGIDNLNEKLNLNGILGLGPTSFDEIIKKLKHIYCSAVGVEYLHLDDPLQRKFIQENFEKDRVFSDQEKKMILYHLVEGEVLEKFVHVKFPGAKRFSIEGGESTLVCMEEIINSAMMINMDEIVLGMAHRGRLNFLTKIFERSYKSMFAEFMGKNPFGAIKIISGDVKYHLGCSFERNLGGKSIILSMLSNPSHLESVNTVVLGSAKAKQLECKKNVIPVLIHGDASFAGQGIVYESSIITTVSNYDVGGVIHIIINNQIGFTATSDEARGVPFCSFIGKGLDIPIFHVNANFPEEVARVTKIAFDFRQKFKKDVIIDLICYRRYGHNEGDEPRFTNPLMYKVIDSMDTIKAMYSKKLIEEKIISQADLEIMQNGFKKDLDDALDEVKNYEPVIEMEQFGLWKGFIQPNLNLYSSLNTGIRSEKLQELAQKLYKIPSGFNANSKIVKLLEDRKSTVDSGTKIDWGTAEALAFASILESGSSIRITGQDAERGTFSHRHAVLIDQENERTYIPLNNLSENQMFLQIANSPLSEFGVMGFEYGYSLVNPNTLTIWEAQYGDFANGAQVIIDQFISSAYVKWLDFSGLVLLLPHGYEGQGPEHTSGRIERFLQLAADDNMQIANITVPSNYFHILRRQVSGNFRSPLIIFTPKSLLRHKMAISSIDEFSHKFCEIIPEKDLICENENVKRVIICSGKLYYDLLSYRMEKNITNVAILRLEQIYPLAKEKLKHYVMQYKNADIVWAQEEPKNMGAWTFINEHIQKLFDNKLIRYVGRKEASVTACGYSSMHNVEQKMLVEEAFN